MELLTVLEVARELRVSRRLVEVLVANGELPAIVLGPKTRRVERGELDAWLRARRAPAGEKPAAPVN